MEKNTVVSYRQRPPIAPHHFEELSLRHGLLPCGIDEAGRGPLAGPVVAAAAMVYGGYTTLLRDSKCLTPKQREEGYQWLLEQSWFGVGIVSAARIDALGIVPATQWAMERALWQLLAVAPVRPACVLVDAVPLQGALCACGDIPAGVPVTDDPLGAPWGKVIAFPQSEEVSYSIAAASIIAKVVRDRLMSGCDLDFPGYGFVQHKGYGTLDHRAVLAARGRSLLHRASFTKNLGALKSTILRSV